MLVKRRMFVFVGVMWLLLAGVGEAVGQEAANNIYVIR
jgi:hypothetical protein